MKGSQMKKNLMNAKGIRGCWVVLEVELTHSRQIQAHSSSNQVTITYWGTYLGVILLAKKPYVVLQDARHYTPSHSHFEFDKSKPGKVCGKLCLVNQERVFSIDLIDEEFDIDSLDLVTGLI